MTEIRVGRFAVGWRLGAAADRPLAAATLARLVDRALEPALEDALHAFAGELVAVRRVRVPEVVVHPAATVAGAAAVAGAADAAADAAAEVWAGQVSAAVAGAIAADGPDVVRYRSRAAAVQDVLARFALGDQRRVWAWRATGLWPQAAADPADAVADLLAADIGCVLAALDAAGAVLPDVVALLGTPRWARLAALAWQAAGGAAEPSGRPAVAAGEPGPAVAAALRRPLGRLLLDLLLDLPAGDRPAGDAPFGRALAEALAVLLVAQADPWSVRAGRGPALVRWVLHSAVPAIRPMEPGLGSPAAEPADAPDGSAHWQPTTESVPADPPGSTDGIRSADNAGSDPGPDPAAPEPSGPWPAAEPPASTRWAGLLFCLHPLRPLLDPGARPEPGRLAVGPELRARVAAVGLPEVLHATGRELAERAAGPPGRPVQPAGTDPALLVLAGRPVGAAAPAPLMDPALAAELADAVLAALRTRLAGRELARVTDPELLRTVLVRTATVVSDPGWHELRLPLDEMPAGVSVDLRAAGLDLDPGWLPALGCVVRFRYV